MGGDVLVLICRSFKWIPLTSFKSVMHTLRELFLNLNGMLCLKLFLVRNAQTTKRKQSDAPWGSYFHLIDFHTWLECHRCIGFLKAAVISPENFCAPPLFIQLLRGSFKQEKIMMIQNRLVSTVLQNVCCLTEVDWHPSCGEVVSASLKGKWSR